MSEGERYSAERVIAAIPESAGIISTIAKRLGCNWDTVRRYIDKYPTVRRAYEQERERVIDMAEDQVISAIERGDVGTAKWYLSTIGRERGYVQRTEVAGVADQPIVIDWDQGSEE